MKELYQEDPESAERRFADLSKVTAANNATFLDERFSLLRQQLPLLDFITVDGEGRVKDNWSSLTDLSTGKIIPTNAELLKQVMQTGEPRYLLKAPRSDLLFYFGNDAQAVADMHDEVLTAMPYSNTKDGRIVLASWTYPRKDAEHAPNGYVVGRMTFWDVRVKSNEKKIGFAVPKKDDVVILNTAYIMRHPATGGKVNITPLSRVGVILQGGLTVDEKYGADRVEVDGSYPDFVTGGMVAYANSPRLNSNPLVLLYKSKDRLEFVHSKPR